MNFEDAANILDPETSLDTLNKIKYYAGFRGEDAAQEAVIEACRIAAKVLWNRVNIKPLTLEQLREMDGWPVYLPEVNCWALVTKDVFATLLTFPDGERCSANDWYEQVGPAYTFHSAYIDREAWKPCGECAPNCSWCKNNDESSRTTPKVCRECKRHSNYEPEYKFCCECGRPLTEEAWAIWRRGREQGHEV